jgi:hypothetical protein
VQEVLNVFKKTLYMIEVLVNNYTTTFYVAKNKKLATI